MNYNEIKFEPIIYVIVQWPWVQSLMSEPWFDKECNAITSESLLQFYDSCSYFVPLHRISDYPTITLISNIIP